MAGANWYPFPLQVGPWKHSTPTAPRKTHGVWWPSSPTREPVVGFLLATTSCLSPGAEMKRTKSLRQCCAGTLKLRSWLKSVSCRGGCLITGALPSGSLTHTSVGLCPGQFLSDRRTAKKTNTSVFLWHRLQWWCFLSAVSNGWKYHHWGPLGSICIYAQSLHFLCTVYP